MNHTEALARGGIVAHAYESYAEERIGELTRICLSLHSNIEQIRQAQAGIVELRKVAELRDAAIREMQEGGN